MKTNKSKKLFASILSAAITAQCIGLGCMSASAEEVVVADVPETTTVSYDNTTTTPVYTYTTTAPQVEDVPIDTTTASFITTAPPVEAIPGESTTVGFTNTTAPLFTEDVSETTETTNTTDMSLTTTTTEPFVTSFGATTLCTDEAIEEGNFSIGVRFVVRDEGYYYDRNNLLGNVNARLVEYAYEVASIYEKAEPLNIITSWNSSDGNPHMIENVRYTPGHYYYIEADIPEGYSSDLGYDFIRTRVAGHWGTLDGFYPVNIYAYDSPAYLSQVEYPFTCEIPREIQLIDYTTGEYVADVPMSLYAIDENGEIGENIAQWSTEADKGYMANLPVTFDNADSLVTFGCMVDKIPEDYEYTNYINGEYPTITLSIYDYLHYMQFGNLEAYNLQVYISPVDWDGSPTYTTSMTDIIPEQTTTAVTTYNTTAAPVQTTTTESTVPDDTYDTTTAPNPSETETETTTTTTLPQTGYGNEYKLIMIVACCTMLLGTALIADYALSGRKNN